MKLTVRGATPVGEGAVGDPFVERLSLSEGPQVVTRRGEEVAVILSTDEYNRLKKSKSSLLEFFRESPLVGVDLEIERDQSLPRDIQL